MDMRSFLQLLQHQISCFARGDVMLESMVKEKALQAFTDGAAGKTITGSDGIDWLCLVL